MTGEEQEREERSFQQKTADPKEPSAAPHGGSLDRSDNTVIDEAIQRPGAVRINVTGAFITDDTETVTPILNEEAKGVNDTRDIRLPHHTAVVSHVAIDVSPRGHHLPTNYVR